MDHNKFARIVLGGWINPTTVAVIGDLSYIRKILETQLAKYLCINYTQPSITVTDNVNPYDYDSYQSINNTMVDISDIDNWVIADRKIYLKTGVTYYNQDTHFDLAFLPTINFATNEIIKNAIQNTIKIYDQQNEIFH